MQDFNLKKIAESGQVFRANELPDGSFEFIAEDRKIVLDPTKPFLKDIQADPFWRNYFDLEKDYAAVRAKGQQRTEGKEYVVKDGDVIEFLFNV